MNAGAAVKWRNEVLQAIRERERPKYLLLLGDLHHTARDGTRATEAGYQMLVRPCLKELSEQCTVRELAPEHECMEVLLGAAGAGVMLSVVEGALVPRNFRFVTIVKQRGDESGGWRAACLRLPIKSDTGDAIICKMGVDMPIKTLEDGLITLPAAQRIAADSGNAAAQIAFAPTTIETPMGIACHPKAESARVER